MNASCLRSCFFRLLVSAPCVAWAATDDVTPPPITSGQGFHGELTSCTGQLLLGRRLDVRVDMGDASLDTFLGALDEAMVVITRMGDRLIVSRHDDTGVNLCVADHAESAPSRTRRDLDAWASRHPFVHVEQEGDVPLDDTGAVDPVRIVIALHDDFARRDVNGKISEESIARVHAGYVAWWLAEMATHVLPGEPIRLSYRTFLAGITDAPYDHERVLRDWSDALDAHAILHGLPWRASHRSKFLLLVPGEFSGNFVGKAFEQGSAAVASLYGRYSVVAHELGHLLGAAHENAEVRYTGWWWCQTSMHDESDSFWSNCLAYSDANRERIRAYVQAGSVSVSGD